MSDWVRLDLNNPQFQLQLFGLGKPDQRGVLLSLKKLSKMNWNQVYRDRGLKWEAILSRSGLHGEKLHTIRMSKGFRAVVVRDGPWLRLLSLHPDHDSAYS